MRARRGAALALALGLWGGTPGAARAQDSAPAEPPRQLTIPAPVLIPETVVVPPQSGEVLLPPQAVRRRRLELLWGGIGAFSVAWAADRFLARDLSQDWKPWLPVLGPWFLLAELQKQSEPNRLTSALVGVGGVLQASGVVLITLGLTLRKDRVVLRLPPAAPAASAPAADAQDPSATAVEAPAAPPSSAPVPTAPTTP